MFLANVPDLLAMPPRRLKALSEQSILKNEQDHTRQKLTAFPSRGTGSKHREAGNWTNDLRSCLATQLPRIIVVAEVMILTAL